MTDAHANSWRIHLHRFIARPKVTRLLRNIVVILDRPLLKLTNGRFSISGFVGGWPIINITTIGARTGIKRTTPLIGIPDQEKIILIASNFARDNHPAWYFNLKKTPYAYINGIDAPYQSREALPEEYERYWELAVNTYLGYENYRQQTSRSIPILVLEPALASSQRPPAKAGGL